MARARAQAVHAMLVVVPDGEFLYFNALARAAERFAARARFAVRVVREGALFSRPKEGLAALSPRITQKESAHKGGRGTG